MPRVRRRVDLSARPQALAVRGLRRVWDMRARSRPPRLQKGVQNYERRRRRGVCKHGKQRYFCLDCGGKGICTHGIERRNCDECGGSGRCPHGRVKYFCKDCGGKGICEHGRQKSTCKECGGSGICPHGKHRHHCKECGGSGICEHGKHRHHCKECGAAKGSRSAHRRGLSEKLITNSNANHGRRALYLSTAIPGSYPAASFHSSTCDRIA